MKNFMNFFILSLFIFTGILHAQDPEYYIKKSTWYETMLLSREKLRSYQEKIEAQRNFKLDEWYTIGPFQAKDKSAFAVVFEPEKEVNFSKTYNDLKWEKKTDYKDGVVNYFQEVNMVANYVFRIIHVNNDTTITVYLGSDDGLKVWLEGEKIFEREVSRGCEPNQEIIDLKLKKGNNNLLMKINNGGGPTAFYFSIDKINPITLLWNLVERDYNTEVLLQEMDWEKKDKIWDDWKNISDLGKKYIGAYEESCEQRNIDPEKVDDNIKTFADLQKIRDKYINSRGNEKIILTPKPPRTPRINGPKIFGVRPGHPFLFTIPTTGDRPMEFSVDNLPNGLKLDKSTGYITGVLNEKKTYDVILHAKNSLGTDKRNFRIVVGDQIALTPPLGWNSWNCFACAVDDGKVRAAADAMVNSGLINHGWTYINIDDCWEIKPKTDNPILKGDLRDANGKINTNKKFPDMKALGDYLHSKGLKMGIYSSPGPTTCAGYTATYNYEEKDAKSYADWGIDYLKYDWCSYDKIAKDQSLPELKKPYFIMRAALDKVERDIVYSLCQYGMGKVWEWGKEVGGNCWRTTGDIGDSWESMSGIGFAQDGHEKFAGPGHWNDPDMLVVGYVGWGPDLHPTGLRPNEQYTHISLWCLLSSPLLIGCDMTRMDDFTVSLLTNDEVLAINQDPLGKPAGRIKKDGDIEIWARDLEDGSKAIGLFNLGKRKAPATLKWSDIGITGKSIVRDLWRQQDIGTFDGEYKATIPPHGVVLVKMSKAK